MGAKNILEEKSMDFAVRIVKLFGYLQETKHEFIMSKQIMRSGTSIGANIAEAQGAQSDADFVARLHIALKECNETIYWLKLLGRTEYLSTPEYDSLINDANELKALLVSILKSTKSRLNS